MKKHKQAIVAFVLFLGLGGLLLSNNKTVSTQSSNKSHNRQESDKSDENFPLVSLDDASKQVESVDEKRRKRNEKFDKWNWVRKTVSVEATSVNLFNDWEVGLPALPVEKSDAVEIGIVHAADAFLSNDETGVYSEFSVSVKDIVKNNQSNQAKLDENIIVQRAGGRILYPSGKILRYSISGQEMPRLNGKYVFFLTYDQERRVYNILTAYEMSNGKISPLDGRGKSKASGFEFGKYEEIDEQRFLNELKFAIDSQNPIKEANTP